MLPSVSIGLWCFTLNKNGPCLCFLSSVKCVFFATHELILHHCDDKLPYQQQLLLFYGSLYAGMKFMTDSVMYVHYLMHFDTNNRSVTSLEEIILQEHNAGHFEQRKTFIYLGTCVLTSYIWWHSIIVNFRQYSTFILIIMISMVLMI
jgi:hypothetical protein